MATDQGAPIRTSGEFIEGAILEAVIPAASSIDFEKEFKNWNGVEDEKHPSIVPFVEQRKFLLLDELVKVYVVLRSPISEENTLRAYVSRLAITLEGHALGSPAPQPNEGRDSQGTSPQPPQQVKETIFSKTLTGSEKPYFMVNVTADSPGGDADHPHSYVYWSVDVFLGRPRTRLQRLAIYFSAAASLKPVEQVAPQELEEEYMPSLVPGPANLLESFAHDPDNPEKTPYLSSARISTIAPPTPSAQELMRPLRSGHRRLFRASPAIFWRLRFSRVNQSLKEPALIASLDFEITPFAGCDVCLEESDLTMAEGHVEAYGPSNGIVTPITGRPGDQFSFLYKLSPSRIRSFTSNADSLVHSVNIKAVGRVLQSSTCQPRVTIEWRTNVDFSPVRQGARARSGSVGKSPAAQIGSPNPDALPQGQGVESEHTANQLTISISGPEEVRVAQSFRWNVLITNNSGNTKRLALIPIPKRKRPLSTGHRPAKSAASAVSVVDAGWDEQFALSKHEPIKAPDILVLSTDVRVGPLVSGATQVAELEFYPMQPGVVQIDALRVVDLSTQEVTDVRDLPDIIVQFARKPEERQDTTPHGRKLSESPLRVGIPE